MIKVCKDCINKKSSDNSLTEHLRKTFHKKYSLEVRHKIDAFVWEDCNICHNTCCENAFFALRHINVNYNV